MSLKIGDKAPDFTLKTQDGKTLRLYDLLAQKPVVLFFYPKVFGSTLSSLHSGRHVGLPLRKFSELQLQFLQLRY